MFRRVTIATLAASALVASLLAHADPALADAPPPGPSVAEAGLVAPVDERSVVEERSSVELDEVEFTGRLEGDTTTDVDLMLDDEGEGTVTLDNGDAAEQELALAVETATTERLALTVTDPATGESFSYDSSKPMKRIVFVIPIAFASISVATALYYIAVGSAVVVGGILALEASKAVGKIVAANKKKPASQKRDYYPAVRNGGKLLISPKGYTKAQAVAKGKARKDVWAISAAKAKSLAWHLNRKHVPKSAENHGIGKGSTAFTSDPNERKRRPSVVRSVGNAFSSRSNPDPTTRMRSEIFECTGPDIGCVRRSGPGQESSRATQAARTPTSMVMRSSWPGGPASSRFPYPAGSHCHNPPSNA